MPELPDQPVDTDDPAYIIALAKAHPDASPEEIATWVVEHASPDVIRSLARVEVKREVDSLRRLLEISREIRDELPTSRESPEEHLH